MAALVIAHRGDSQRAPENTLPAIEMAIEAGSEMVELDVRVTRDGQFIIFHDVTLARLCGLVSRVRHATFERLSRADVGLHKSNLFRGARIPRLSEALSCAAARVGILLDIKGAGRNFDLFGHRMAREIERSGCAVTLQSADAEYLRRMKELYPRYKTSLVARRALGVLRRARKAGVDVLHIYHRAASAKLLRAAHKAGLALYVYTVNRPAAARKLALKGVDGITTSRPLEIRRALAQTKSSPQSDFLRTLKRREY